MHRARDTVLQRLTQLLYRHLPDTPDQRFRGLLLLYVQLTMIALDTGILLIFLFVVPMHMDELTRLMSLQIIAAGGVLQLLLLLVLLRGWLKTAAIALVAITTLALGTTIMLTGGTPESPALSLLLVPAVLTFCLLGPKPGIVYVLTIPLALLAQWYTANYWGWTPLALQSTRNPDVDALLIAGLNFFVVIAVLLVYERMNAQLRAERDADRLRLAALASQDDLTGLANRRQFHTTLLQACARCDRTEQQLAVLYIDLNGFKHINDSLGHGAGDQVLVRVAQRLRDSLRLQDFVARLGGDEFAVILEPAGSRESVREVEEKLLACIQQPIPLQGQTVRVGASIGVALYPADAAHAEQILRRADAEMYRVKRQG